MEPQTRDPLVPLAILTIAAALSGCGGANNNATVSANEVAVRTSNMRLVFARKASFTGTYLTFGGAIMDRADAIMPREIHEVLHPYVH